MEQNIIEQEALNISDAQSLKSAIEKVQVRVTHREKELKNLLGQLPKEGIKSATAMALPTILTTKVAGASVSGAWNLVKLAAGQKKAILPLLGAAAKIGLFTFLKKKVQVVSKKR